MATKPGLIRRLFMCSAGWCAFHQASDDTHLWGECTICGKRSGAISREAVRRYLEAEERDRASNAGRRALAELGAPAVSNIEALVGPKIWAEAQDDARAALQAALRPDGDTNANR